MNFDIQQAWSIKNLLYGKKTIFFLDTAGNPERQDSAILPAGVANRSAGFCLSAHGTSHIMTVNTAIPFFLFFFSGHNC